MSEDISDSELYYNRRSEAALCRDFPADAPIIDALYRWQMQIWNYGNGQIPVLRVMNCAHRVAARMLSGLYEYDDRNGYDYRIFRDMDNDRFLMSIVIVVLVSMLRCIEDSDRARTCISIITDDRPEDFYERLSLFNDYMNASCKIRCREKDLLQDATELVERIAQLEAQQQQDISTIANLKTQIKHMEATQNNQFNAPVYKDCTFQTTNNTTNNYGVPPSERVKDECLTSEGAQDERVSGLTGQPFKFIHPSVTDDAERLKIHREVQNLVHTLPLPDICRYLRQMWREQRIFLNIKPDIMFAELHRMGMPDEDTPGFSKKNFVSYFNVND